MDGYSATMPRILTIILCMSLALGGCSSEPNTPSTPPEAVAEKAEKRADKDQNKRKPHIIMVVLDTVRQDHLSLYGYERNTSPNLSAMADYATVFNTAYATSCWTSPSHASLFTGLYASGHQSTQEKWHLEQSLETMAELLAARGYETVGVTGNAVIRNDAGFGQGFKTYHESWRKTEASPKKAQDKKELQPKLTTDALTVKWIKSYFERRDSKRPLFLFVNLIGAHTPYNSCGDNCGIYGSEIMSGLVFNEWRDYYRGRQKMGKPQWKRLTNLYDAELRELDNNFGKILGIVNDNLRKKNTFFAVTSDHGENLGDHGHVSHVFSLHESTTRIPMMIRYPEHFEKGLKSQRPVQLVDLFPTILELAGVKEIPKHHGHSLLKEATEPDRPLLTEYFRPLQALATVEDSTAAEKQAMSRYDRRIKSLHQDGWKLHWGSDDQHELYHLAEDPDEENDRVADTAQAARLKTMIQTLEGLVKRYEEDIPAPGDVPEIDEATRAELEALGYLGD
jgi:arylsulfatase A-like enzyme